MLSRTSYASGPSQVVVVTGASTGIGRAVAEDLANSGHQVFASVRRDQDAKEIAAANRYIIPVLLDVAQPETIASAHSQIQRDRLKDRPFSIINNAGIVVHGPLEEVQMEDFRRQFEVNVFGALQVIKTFLPLVRENKGRIINMSSLSGLISAPFLGAYCASKFALEAISDSLRIELATDGIKVLLIEPGPIKTPLWEKGLLNPRMPEGDRYRKAMERFEHHVKVRADGALPTQNVVRAVRRSLFEPAPPVRQIVASLPAKIEVRIARHLPARVIDNMIVSRIFGTK